MLQYKTKTTSKNLDVEFDTISSKLRVVKFPTGFLQTILYIFSELFDNVREHAQAKTVTVEINISGGRCYLIVNDDGIGFRKSYLAKKINPKDDLSAIELALSGLSTKDTSERGFGLYSIRKLTELAGGVLKVATGLGSAAIEKNKITFHEAQKNRRGVSLNLKLPVRAVNIYKILK